LQRGEDGADVLGKAELFEASLEVLLGQPPLVRSVQGTEGCFQTSTAAAEEESQAAWQISHGLAKSLAFFLKDRNNMGANQFRGGALPSE